MFKNALVSVSDKTGLVEFLKPLCDKGLRIVSTGGTAQHLRLHGIQAVDVAQQTGFQEVMGGRVKTLHPKIHMALLARDLAEDQKVLQSFALERFDLVIVNLYPFEKTLVKKSEGETLTENDLIEKIDIGGPAMVRAAAKNFKQVTVLTDPRDYSWIGGKEKISEEDRRILAGKAFAHVSRYDSLVSHFFGAFWGDEISFGGLKVQDLRYGENPQQKATWYGFSGDRQGLHSAEVLQGKELSYNNILDIESASLLLQSLGEKAAVVVKHNNPCGAGIVVGSAVSGAAVAGGTVESATEAMQKALAADPVSAFGGIVAFGSTLGVKEATLLNSLFLECVVAPDYTPEALQNLKAKKNLRLLKWPGLLSVPRAFELRSVSGGFLLQTADRLSSPVDSWQFLGETPEPDVLADLVFAEKVCASLKSNAIAIVRNGQTVGLGMGQVNRVDAVEQAIHRMRQHHPSHDHAVLASDAFFPFPDSIEKIAAAGIRWVLQPGGSVKDQDVFEAARRLGVQLVVTGRRHFRH
ncbi:MAG: bifunctional phosphoribosylaminoimidazolecarboxamide formyltransferase/IMP cyclohydrolase PurH [Bdellovibrio sp.]|nr:MAG: bifunctional phosphoribosylaminoimidazolecarboxamide formyltransferase/IMP cyclohydrolase PurH [Bdellovibrio sp.]